MINPFTFGLNERFQLLYILANLYLKIHMFIVQIMKENTLMDEQT